MDGNRVRIAGTHHVALTTSNLARQREFYVEALGLPVVGGFPGHGILFVRAGDTVIELVEEDAPPGGSRRGGWDHLALAVEDVDDAHAALLARGAKPHSPPEDFPPENPALRIAFLRDPDGNLLELVQPLSERITPARCVP
ncbi:MAG TPA: VOC family protein [Thermomicrobiaceae bacterium]|nr:VOC family protein [Thermomicrobiaceae bacterium]